MRIDSFIDSMCAHNTTNYKQMSATTTIKKCNDSKILNKNVNTLNYKYLQLQKKYKNYKEVDNSSVISFEKMTEILTKKTLEKKTT